MGRTFRFLPFIPPREELARYADALDGEVIAHLLDQCRDLRGALRLVRFRPEARP